MYERIQTGEATINGFNELMYGAPHVIARTQLNARLIEMAQVELGLAEVSRFPVPAEKARWNVTMPEYNPFFIDLPRGTTSFRKSGDSPDPADPSKIESFFSHETYEVRRDMFGRPVNPVARTGLHGRGMLDKWGPTQAVDTVFTRVNQSTGILEVLLIEREDTGEKAVPGGKVKDGEEIREAAAREAVEEVGVHNIELNLASAPTIYRGYVDDSRNTDNAWLESTVFHRHLSDEEAKDVVIVHGDDAVGANWFELNEKLCEKLFASHGRYLRAIMSE